MKSTNLSELSEQELLEEEKKQKISAWAFRVFMVFMMGAAVWNATHKGSSIIAFLPLFLISFFVKSENKYKALKTEVQSRKSQ